MRRLLVSLSASCLLACGSHGDDPPRSCGADWLEQPPVTQPQPLGRFSGFVIDGGSRTVNGRASAYEQGSASTAFTVLDGYQVDAENRPTSELFVFLRSRVRETDVNLVPVTLEQLKDGSFVPSGSFAVFAEAYSAEVKDYTRWLIAKSGCLRVHPPSETQTWEAEIVLVGEWRSNTGALIGPGSGSLVMSGPLLHFAAGSNQLRDTAYATVTGQRAELFSATTLDAFQVLHPSQTRMVIVATQPADTTRELWISIDGVPQPGDSIALDAATLEEARAGRAAPPRSFAMLRMLELENTKSIVREVWRSTIGYVKFVSITQGGPLALCGWASGNFAFVTEGTSLASPATSLGESGVSNGSFSTRFTILSPSDTLVDPAELPAAPWRMQPAAPGSTQGYGCP